MKNRKTKYSMLNTMGYALGNLWRWNKEMFLCCIIQIPCNFILPFITVLFTKTVVELVTNMVFYQELIFNIIIYTLIIIVVNIILNIAKTKVINSSGSKVRLKYTMMVDMKNIETDYENIENPKGQESLRKANAATDDIMSGTQTILMNFVTMVSGLINIIIYGIIISTISPLLMIVLCIPVVMDFFASKKKLMWSYKNRNNWIPIDRKLSYIVNKTSNMAWAKELRLYNMTEWMNSLFNKVFKDRIHWKKKENIYSFITGIFSIMMLLIRDGVSYGYLVYQILFNQMAAADFVFYSGSLKQFSSNFSTFFNSINSFLDIHLQITDLRNFLNMEDKTNRDPGASIDEKQYEIEFINVSYTFEGKTEPTLKDINCKICKGQKVALIGHNGAGKTTFVKLLCGLYTPTTGSILINGRKISEYNLYDYFKLFSVVFQDIYLLPTSIEKNVTMQTNDQINYAKLKEVSIQSGFESVIHKLPNGWETNLIKSTHDDKRI